MGKALGQRRNFYLRLRGVERSPDFYLKINVRICMLRVGRVSTWERNRKVCLASGKLVS